MYSTLESLKAAVTLEDVYHNTRRRLHPLSQNREGQFAVDILKKNSKYRLIFYACDSETGEEIEVGDDKFEFYESVRRIKIKEVSDKHYD